MIPAAFIFFILAGVLFIGTLVQSLKLNRLNTKNTHAPAVRRAIWDASRYRWFFSIGGSICLIPAIILLVAGLSAKPQAPNGGSASIPSSTVTIPSSDPTSEPTSQPTTVPTETSRPTSPPFDPTFPEITWMTFPEGRDIQSEIYFVYSCDTGTFTTLSGAPDQRVYPASVTKLFTSYVALSILPEGEKIRVGNAVSLINKGSSVAELYDGHRLTPEGLVTAMLLPSGNDAAYAIAQAAGNILAGEQKLTAEEAVALFVKEMNRQAEALGLTGSHFANPDGWHDEKHYTCVEDLVQIGQLALNHPIISRCMKKAGETVAVSSSKTRTWYNTNHLIHTDNKYYCPYAVGMKTGYTKAAQNCLLSAFTFSDSTWIIGTFRCESKTERFADTLYLLNETIKAYQ